MNKLYKLILVCVMCIGLVSLIVWLVQQFSN